MRLSPVVCALLAIFGSQLLSASDAPKEDRVVFSTTGTDTSGRSYSLKVRESFVSGASWESADLEGVALQRIIEVAREALDAKKLSRGEEVSLLGVAMRKTGRARIAFVNFRVGKNWNVSIAVNALFQTLTPDEK